MKKILITSMIILIFIFTYFMYVPETIAFTSLATVSGDESALEEAYIATLSTAESTLAEAYVAVLSAEEAGVNTGELLDNLNIAGDYLSQCRIAIRAKEYDDAMVSAELCTQIASLISVEAVRLTGIASSERPRALLILATYTTVYISGVSLGGVFLWRKWKRRYIDRLQKMEVRSVNESK